MSKAGSRGDEVVTNNQSLYQSFYRVSPDVVSVEKKQFPLFIARRAGMRFYYTGWMTARICRTAKGITRFQSAVHNLHRFFICM